MLPAPKSLRELHQELTGIRLAAVNNSIWQMSNLLEERSRVAINDAIRAFPMWVRATESSILHNPSVHMIAIPPYIEKINEIFAYHVSDASTRVQVTFMRHVPSEQTNFLRVDIPAFYPLENSVHKTGNWWLTIDYQHRLTELPQKRVLAATIAVADGVAPVVYPGSLAGQWQPKGYIEFVKASEAGNINSVSIREIAYYSSINPAVGFYIAGGRNQLNAVGNTAWNASTVGGGVHIYPVIVAPPDMLSVVMAQAQASMYDYWVGNRAMYDVYVTMANVAQLDVDELLRLVRTYEVRAQERYTRLTPVEKRHAPAPARVAVQRRKDVNP